VLVDTGPVHYAAWRRLARERGRDVTLDEFRPTFGMRNADVIRAFYGDLPPAEAAALADQKERYFREAAPSLQPQPGVRELLKALARAGFAQAVASSAPPENVAYLLDVLGIRGAFEAIVTGADVRRGKPDPAVFLLAAERLGVPPARCVVVEDAVVGVEAARAAGMRCVAVTTTSPPDQLRQADLVVDSLTELRAEVFERLIGRA
jgi:beta-phosphoglucomutase